MLRSSVPFRVLTVLAAVILLPVLFGCSGEGAVAPDSDKVPAGDSSYDPPDAVGEEGLVVIDVVPEPKCEDQGVLVRHVATWPGHGARLLLSGNGSQADLLTLLEGQSMSVSGAEPGAIPMAVAAAEPDARYCLLLFDLPDDPLLALALQEAASAFVENLDATVQVALYRRCTRLEQVSEFTSNRALLAALLDGADLDCPGPERADLTAVLDEAAAETWAVGGTPYPAARSLVLVAGDPGLGEFLPPVLPMGVDVFVVAQGPDRVDDAPSRVGGQVEFHYWDEQTVPADALGAVAARMDELAASYVAAGACLGADADPLSVSMPSGAMCEIPVPGSLVEEAALPCDPKAVAEGKRVYPDRIEFLMTPDQRKVFDQVHADKLKDEFPLSVRVGDSAPIEAMAHLRGHTTMDCVRKSFSVNLKGPLPRHLRPFLANDEFHLISMCKDDRYYQQYTANLLARDQGLFPLQFGMVELLVEGETRGVFLLLEKPKDGILEVNSRVKSIVRRRFDPEAKPPDIEYPPATTPEDPAIDSYWNLVEGLGDLAGEALIEKAGRQMDLDGFLRFLAFHSLMGNGDYVDEIFFYSAEAVRGDVAGDWFRVMAWDMDDLYCACHHSGKHAMPDPFGMLFCAEGNLEKRLLADPLVYERFVDTLEWLIQDGITAEAVDQALEQTAADLLPFFSRPEICAAMVELVKSNPQAVDPEVAQADIQAAMDTLRTDYVKRSDKLLGKIAAYRAQQGEQ